jgi:4-carboxymuconolactone decarboxylase
MPHAGGGLSDGDRALILLSAAVATGTDDEVEARLEDAVRATSSQRIEEALLQSHLFIGYPRALAALEALRRIEPEPAVDAAESGVDRAGRGERVCRVVYGDSFERLRANVGALHPELPGWMIEDGYGRVLGRPGLDLRTRELCVVALLAAQPTPAQLYSHLRGALNAGATEAEVGEVLARVLPPGGAVRERALHVWRAVRSRRADTNDGGADRE